MGSKFRILIVEDTADKGDVVQHRLLTSIGEVDPEIEIVKSLVEALRRLESTYFELVILDIMIPAAGGTPRAEHSRTIIEQLRSGRLVMPACVIGLTAFADKYRAELKYYRENLFSIERYDAQTDEWLDNIVSRVRFLHKWKSAYARAINFSYDYDVIILTARYETEYKPILGDIEWASGPSDDLLLYKDKKLKLGTVRVGKHLLRLAVYCTEGMGMPAAAAATAQLISQFRPKMVCMLGMCCGFRQDKCQNKSRLGDVIVVRESACWDEGRYAELDDQSFFFNRAKPRALNEKLDQLVTSLVESGMKRLHASMQTVWGESNSTKLRKKFKDDSAVFPDVKYGLLVSGSSVIAHDVKGDEIITRFSAAIGVDMEVFGVYTAVDRSAGAKPVVIGVKGVADFGDGSKHKHFQPLASRLSLCVGKIILEGYFDGLVDNTM